MSDKDSNKLSTTFSGPLSTHGPKWSSLWEENYTPWDRAVPSIALRDLLASRPDLVPSASRPSSSSSSPSSSTQRPPRALVPGCGRGHDVLLLSLAFGYDVVGLDYAPGAIKEAVTNQHAVEAGLQEGDEKVTAHFRPAFDQGAEAGRGKGEVRWVSGDFFDDAWLEECGVGRDGRFDLIFDYTFLCALPPSARPKWAARMASLLHPSTGRLVCLEFPSGKPLSEPGPPWGLTPDIYVALLARPGEDLVFENGEQVRIPPLDPEKGLRRLDLIKPARTHNNATNEDGTVRDWIHVWAHARAVAD
ncbi:S-adenosyl-L-methionine-dependent methyltransferase [Sodiomyces alkalinus F11]|uniref:S-adenosyl-L-methionine-dependent methyltransferase n=1 Tax=Sodiomyces alkalinus (strain CBS 110278 / VKM F-3762 / F11) TaxID=1314773 RepID=A0A3N2PJD1_SODAK|nr:S-adenosyl-L-methionine-dependent methyltransferase [Sodiomyces alkalinus F11]ROT34641.1 S-adenosyl-L-methionine-dependent methyltransferase [Sodiomyces alkalinus F11]